MATPVVTLSVTTPTSVDQGESLNLTASVQNDIGGAGVKWGITCSGTNCGTLSSQTSGAVTYTAPSSVTTSQSGTITATSAANGSVSASLAVMAVPAPAIPFGAGTVNGAGIPAGTQGTAYNDTLVVSGGVAPYTWSITTGALPTGMTLSTTGVLSGTPSVSGTYSATVTVKDSGSPAMTATAALTFPIAPQITPLAVVTGSLSSATQGVAYSAGLTATSGTAPYTWGLASGSGALPAGITLSAAGVFSGTPTASGAFPITVQVQDASTPVQTGTKALTLTVVPPVLTVTTTSIPAATEQLAYSYTLAAVNGTGTLKWTIATGALPTGITLSTAGVLAGTVTVTGTYSFTVAVQDSASSPNSASASFTIVANPPGTLAITTVSVANGTVGTPYSVAVTATGGKTGYTWSVSSGSLPTNLSLVGGYIEGMSTASGTYTFTVKVTDSSTPAQTATQTLSITIAAIVGTNNGALKGQYAFFLRGGADNYNINTSTECTTMTMVGSFVADGSGNITQGEYDSVCGSAATSSHLFTGTYAVAANNTGELVMTNVVNTQSTFAFTLNQIVSGVAHGAAMIEYDDLADGTPGNSGSGVFQMQTPAAFTANALNGNYVYGLTASTAAAGSATFNGSGGIAGPSVTGSYATPDSVFGRTTFNFNTNNYVMYIVNGQQAFIAAVGTSLPAASITVGQLRQQSGAFSNASLSGTLAAYGVSASGGFNATSGAAVIEALSADGAGHLIGTAYNGNHYGSSQTYGTTPIATTYSVSSNGLALLGTGDVIWLYAPNAGYSVSQTISNGLFTYEPAIGTTSTTPSGSIETLPLTSTNFILTVTGESGTGYIDSQPPSTYGYSNGLSMGTLPACTALAAPAMINLTMTRGVCISGSDLGYTSTNILIFQQ